MLRVILTIVQVFSSLAIIGLVLRQRGKGAEAGAGFGAGASGTVFGARGASTALSRATAIFAAVFMINSLLLTYVGTKISDSSQPRTILDQATDGQSKTPADATKTPTPNTATVPAPTPTPPSPTSAPAPAAPEGTAPPEGAPPK